MCRVVSYYDSMNYILKNNKLGINNGLCGSAKKPS
jgi:hypothetical protein